MNFPDYKLGHAEMTKLGGFYYPPKTRLWQDLLCPWPIQMGEPTLSVIRFHKKQCSASMGRNDDPCICPKWKAYLKKEIKTGGK